MSGIDIHRFDSELAVDVDNETIPGFGVAQAGMVRRLMFMKLFKMFDEDPIVALQTIAHLMELEKHRDAE